MNLVQAARDAGRVHLSLAGTALAVGLGYYAGSLIGFFLQLPPDPPSVLWPPNAILTAALLLTSPRRWTWLVLAVLPAHLATQLPTGWPLSMILSLYATNCGEALIAAWGLRLLSDEPTRLDTLRRFGAFLCAAVIAAPLISTFPDAAVVAAWQGESYGSVWRSRLLSNTLAQLTVTPAIVGIVARARAWLRDSPMSRYVEAAVLGTCLLVSGWVTFGAPFEAGSVPAALTETPLLVQLPFVLWAALRFGPVGTSLALLVMTCIAASAVVHGGTPFRRLQSEELVFAVQIFLIMVAVTLLGLATLIEERRLSTHALGERLRFERLHSEFSRAFVQVPSEQIHAVCHQWIAHVGAFLNLECVRLFQAVGHGDDIVVVSEWRRPGFGPAARMVFKRDFPWMLSRVLARSPVVLPSLKAVPAEAVQDYESLKAQGYNAVLLVPLLTGERLVGALAFGTAVERAWPDEVVENLRLLSEVLANAVARSQTDGALKSSESMKSAILNSLTSGVAVIDAGGRVLDLNANWIRLAEESRVMPHLVRMGDDLLDVLCSEVVTGVRAVLNGSKARVAVEHVTTAAAGTRWWLFVASRLNRGEGGAVVTLVEVTERRRAEIEVQQSRQLLAHVGRVATMGELTSSLAHQLNQPLTGILSNAQAARRFLDRIPPDYAELREAMSDIAEDARRASDVIKRLRELLRKGEFEPTPVDLSAVIRDVANLVGSDAIIRNVAVKLDLEGEPTVVRGDRVQLQQVVLNLLVNALEAIGEDEGERAVHVSCQRVSEDEVRVLVRDSGAGLAEGTEEAVFDPFYTTKRHGMGMGLSIARSIVETHGGSIRARNDQEQGAVFEFSLPAPESAQPVSEDQRAGHP